MATGIEPDPIIKLIEGKGYPAESHDVTTEDGFILRMHRIPRGKGQSQGEPRPAVLLQHGLADSAATWIMTAPDKSLGTILADAGYDVWLANSRGNTYSLGHTSAVSKDDYWKWSWDEMQKYDLPAVINYILTKTGQKQLSYVGHSQGTLIGFAAFSSNQSLAQKIAKFIALAPVAAVSHVKGAAKLLIDMWPLIKAYGELFNGGSFARNSEDLERLAKVIQLLPFDDELLLEVTNLIGGPDSKECNSESLFQVLFDYYPAGTSLQNMDHYYQMHNKNTVTFFDYGSETRNRQHYNQPTPPVYDLTQMKVPTYLFSGSKDFLADPEDVNWLVGQLTCIVKHEVHPDWNHLDFVWGVHEVPTMYKNIAEILGE